MHVRIFDRDGHQVTDTDETKLPPAQAQAILILKQRVPGLLPPHVMSGPHKARILGAVASIDVRPLEGRQGLGARERSRGHLVPDGCLSREVAPLAGLQSRWRGDCNARDESGRRRPASMGYHDGTIAIRHPASVIIPVDAGGVPGGFQPRRAPYCLRPEPCAGGRLGRRRRHESGPLPGARVADRCGRIQPGRPEPAGGRSRGHGESLGHRGWLGHPRPGWRRSGGQPVGESRRTADRRNRGPAGFLTQGLGRDGPVAPLASQTIHRARRGDSE